MFVGEIMAKRLITVSPGDEIDVALRLMIRHDIRHLPVVEKKEKKKILGIISSHDVTRRMDPDKARASRPIRVEEVMQRDLVTVSSSLHVQEAARIIYGKKFGGLPVVDKGVLVGIITYQDILGVFIAMMDGLEKSARIDVRIQGQEDVAAVKLLLEGEGCKIIGMGQSRTNKGQDICSFRIRHRETGSLFHLLSDAGYTVVEHFS